MKAFFDTSVLVGAFYGDHPKHSACLKLLEDASKKTHFCAAHAVAELYAVMTRLPVRPRITPEQGLLFVENVRDNLSIITLSAAEQFEGLIARFPFGNKAPDALLKLGLCQQKTGAQEQAQIRRAAAPRPTARQTQQNSRDHRGRGPKTTTR